MAAARLVAQLPDELLQDILERLAKPDLSRLSLVSKWCYKLATPLIWRDVSLVDCRAFHEDGVDEHDDTPLLRKLLVLAKNPLIASTVQTITHRCHLPPPAIFDELPATPFSGQTLSPDPRTTKLIQLAVQHMTRIHTVRIIFGHPNINDALLRSFFDRGRNRVTPIRRLWLENCRFSAGCDLQLLQHPLDLPLNLDFSGLESIRFRRLPIRAGRSTPRSLFEFVHARTISTPATTGLQDSAGGYYFTTTNAVAAENDLEDPNSSIETLIEPALGLDERIYSSLAAETVLPSELQEGHVASQASDLAYRGPLLDPSDIDWNEADDTMRKINREKRTSADVAIRLLNSACGTLTSICLDWVMTIPTSYRGNPTLDSRAHGAWLRMFVDFFKLRFPHLTALQFRNAVVSDTKQPEGLYLLDHAQVQTKRVSDAAEALADDSSDDVDLVCLRFMELHPNLQCLAWPMESFFSDKPLSSDIVDRVGAVVDNLGRTLVDLRVDTLYSGSGELQTDQFRTRYRDRRRHFISDFASRMTKVESIKIEGGVPRDERRETIRALHACPLKKIVLIGVCSIVGNTWGAEGRDLGERLTRGDVESLEFEHKDAIFNSGFKTPVAPPSTFRFEPTYGWPPGPPLIHTIASYHADTVTELKFCGYKGAPILFNPTAVTSPMLHALKHFRNLESLILSMWLSTVFEEAGRDADIIKYWLDARSPYSTSLVRTVIDEEPEGWERELRTKFSPDAIAWYITTYIGQFLSETAKAREGGVHVRVSMCIGEGGIFDIDLRIGKGSLNSDICLSYKGPREELEPHRRRSKLENRRWF